MFAPVIETITTVVGVTDDDDIYLQRINELNEKVNSRVAELAKLGNSLRPGLQPEAVITISERRRETLDSGSIVLSRDILHNATKVA